MKNKWKSIYKNKKAFSLIQLLAVIAILALIATPVVIKVINNAKDSAILRSAEFYDEAVINAVTKEKINGKEVLTGNYTINENGNICQGSNCITVEIKGKKPSNTSTLTLSLIKKDYQINDAYLEFDEVAVRKINGKYVMPKSASFTTTFANDSWKIIKAAVNSGNTSNYHVGDTKTVDMGSFGTHTVRIANMSKCTNGETSETACGFVVEFADIIAKHNMNSEATNVGGWESSAMRSYVNNDIYNALPSDLRGVIASTTVVSGHGSTAGEANFTTTDKLYLLSGKEVFDSADWDTAYNTTRQLDYYANIGVTTSNYSGAIKNYNGNADWWWLRSASSPGTTNFLLVAYTGNLTNDIAANTYGGFAAFQIE